MKQRIIISLFVISILIVLPYRSSAQGFSPKALGFNVGYGVEFSAQFNAGRQNDFHQMDLGYAPRMGAGVFSYSYNFAFKLNSDPSFEFFVGPGSNIGYGVWGFNVGILCNVGFMYTINHFQIGMSYKPSVELLAGGGYLAVGYDGLPMLTLRYSFDVGNVSGFNKKSTKKKKSKDIEWTKTKSNSIEWD